MKKMFFVVILLLVVIFAIGCSFNEVEDITLQFYDGSTLIETSTVYKYNKNPFVPKKEGFEFTNWYYDKECTKVATINDIKSDCVLYAGWIEKGAGSRYYHIVFCSNDGTTLKQMNVNKIEDLVFPDAPQKDGYAFVGWDPKPKELNSDMIIYAKYAKEYIVDFFYDADDSVPISHQIVLEGQSAVPPNEPTKIGDMQYSYTFSGWSTSFENVQSDLHVVAKFSKVTNKYTYTFKNYDGTILLSKTANYGTKINPPNATKESDETYVYSFIGWDLTGNNNPDVLPQTLVDNFEAVALFGKNLKSFTVNFLVDENIISSVEVTYGDTVKYLGDTPQKASDAQFNYTFIGWDKSFDNITEDTNVIALFQSSIRRYTYTFIDCTGEIYSQTADYGTDIFVPEPHEKERDDAFVYPFSHWTNYIDGMILDDNYTFEAVYTPQKRMFTYTFKIGKDIFWSGEGEYGMEIIPPEPPESTDGTVFVKWIGFTEGMILTKDIIFTALYK